MINSHIRMPKCVLKQFADEKHFVYFWNIETGWIQKSHAESINTKEDYFSEEVEHFLRDNIETPLGHILNFIKSIDPNIPEFSMDNDKKTVIRRYVCALVARSQLMLVQMSKMSVFAPSMSVRDLHDVAAVIGIAEAINSQLFEDWEITFMVNHTENTFVLPLCGTYSYAYNGDPMFNVPITPNYAITFMPQAVAHKYVIGRKMRLFPLVDSERAMQFNMLALSSEQKDGNYGIAANSRQILEKMKASIE